MKTMQSMHNLNEEKSFQTWQTGKRYKICKININLLPSVQIPCWNSSVLLPDTTQTLNHTCHTQLASKRVSQLTDFTATSLYLPVQGRRNLIFLVVGTFTLPTWDRRTRSLNYTLQLFMQSSDRKKTQPK